MSISPNARQYFAGNVHVTITGPSRRWNQRRSVSLIVGSDIDTPVRSALGDVALIWSLSRMEKLQDTIDRVFGNVDHKPTPQPLGDAALQRERAFAENARKLEGLRAARLAKAGSKPSKPRRRSRTAGPGQ